MDLKRLYNIHTVQFPFRRRLWRCARRKPDTIFPNDDFARLKSRSMPHCLRSSSLCSHFSMASLPDQRQYSEARIPLVTDKQLLCCWVAPLTVILLTNQVINCAVRCTDDSMINLVVRLLVRRSTRPRLLHYGPNWWAHNASKLLSSSYRARLDNGAVEPV